MPTWLENTFGTVGPSANPYRQYQQWRNEYWASPEGLREMDAYEQTTRLNRRELLARLKAERDRIAIAKGEAEANQWYQRAQVKLAQQTHALRVSEVTGYHNGAPTLQRETSQADVALRAGQLGASLRGPRDWATYLRTSNDVAGSPASSFVNATPGGLGQNNVNTRRMTLKDVLGDFGMGNGGGMVGQSGAMGGGAATGTMPGAPAPNSAGLTGGPNPNGTYQPVQQPVGQMPGGASALGLGLNPGEEQQLRQRFSSPNSAPMGWWESKSSDQRDYLRGLMDEWGYSPTTFEEQYANSRPRQGNALEAGF